MRSVTRSMGWRGFFKPAVAVCVFVLAGAVAAPASAAERVSRYSSWKNSQPANSVPSISGSPSTGVTAGQAYAFRPSARDANGDALSFSIANKPRWASFSVATGALTGKPASGSVGTYANIKITVSDGKAKASLAPFSIAVKAAAAASPPKASPAPAPAKPAAPTPAPAPTTKNVTVNWTPPTQNTNGSTLTNLAGYRILYGNTRGGPYPTSVAVANPSISSYVVSNLKPATYYFVVVSRNASGKESAFSQEAFKVLN